MNLLRKLRSLLRRNKHDAEMREEMRQHIEEQTRRNVAAGMDADEARYAAERAFGNRSSLEERVRDARGVRWVDDALQDLRFAFRQMRKAPGFTIVAVLTLAIGIGATTAMFSVVYGVVLSPLDFPDSSRLVAIHETYPPDHRENVVAWGNYFYWADHASSFANVAASEFVTGSLLGAGEPMRVWGLRVTSNYFSTLGVQSAMGRGFRPDESKPGAGNVIVVSNWFWTSKLSSRPDVTGLPVRFNGQGFTIIGVLPPNEQLNSNGGVFLPMPVSAELRENRQPRQGNTADVIARLKPGVSLPEAQSEMNVLADAMAEQFPTDKGRGAKLLSLRDEIVAHSGGFLMFSPASMLFLFFGAVGFLLLIACVNLANLLLARATTRRKEIAMRAALGASRGRIVRQLLCESLLLAALGAVVGVLFAHWGLDLLKPLIRNLPRAATIALDSHALAFTCVVAVITGIATGLVPARQGARSDLLDGIRDNTGGGARGSHRLRSALVIVEMSLALVLLTGAGLLIRGFVKLQDVDLGFEPDGVFASVLPLSDDTYATAQSQNVLADALVDRLRDQPQVKSVALTTGMPIFGSFGSAFRIEGQSQAQDTPMPAVLKAAVTPDYFKTLGIPVIRGRTFSEEDAVNSSPVIIISAGLAEKYFHGRDLIGQRISLAHQPDVWREVVGVVGDVRQWGPASNTINGAISGGIYTPFAQDPSARNLLLVVQSREGAVDLPVAVRTVVHWVDPNLPLANLFVLADGVAESAGKYRLSLWIFSIFAGIALLLAMIGIYGVVSHSVAQRTTEFGVRMALGARVRDIYRLVLFRAGREIGIGIVCGVAGAFAGSRLLRSLLFETSPQDPATYGAVIFTLSCVAVFACWLPARRATKVDPAEALRAE